MRVKAFAKYGREAASTRQRLLQYIPALQAAGISVEVHALLDDDYVRALATGERFSKAAIARSYLSRLRQLLRSDAYDALWVYAELFPYLPSSFERLAFRAGKPVVYDFDDAFFVTYDEMRGAAGRLLRGKLEPLIAGASACCCGNDYLRAYASRLNPNSVVLPTVVDTGAYVAPPARSEGPATIGWIGSPSTWRYVRPLLPLFARLCQSGARFLAVGAGHEADADGFWGAEFVQWTEAIEVPSVQRMDIGIMPLPNEPWTLGKSGYKLIQYMACGVPVIASRVGANTSIVQHGVNGFLADDAATWRAALETLIGDESLRRRMGDAGRQRAVSDYSLQSQAPRLVKVFRDVIGS